VPEAPLLKSQPGITSVARSATSYSSGKSEKPDGSADTWPKPSAGIRNQADRLNYWSNSTAFFFVQLDPE